MSSLNARKPLVGSSFGPSCRMPTGIHHLLLGNLTTGWIHRCRLFFFFLGQRTNSLPSSPLLSRPLPLEIGSQIQPGAWENALSSPSGVWGEAAADKRFAAHWSQNVQLWWQQFLLILLRTSVIFCTKQAWYRTAGPVPHRAAPYEEFFSWPGAVAAIAPLLNPTQYKI